MRTDCGPKNDSGRFPDRRAILASLAGMLAGTGSFALSATLRPTSAAGSCEAQRFGPSDPSDAERFVEVDASKRGFRLSGTDRAFVPWGFNYDHDPQGRLIEDYWEDEPELVETHLKRIAETGATVVRIHLQAGRFLLAPDRLDAAGLDRLMRLIEACTRVGLRIDLTGLGCYHRADVPPWYDALDETGRWAAQATFWRRVAERCASSPAIFCYDLMNEPVVPGGSREAGAWLGPDFAGKHFVQFVTLEQSGRERREIASAWTEKLVSAIREVDSRHLITIGLVDWSLPRPGLTSGFEPEAIGRHLDFLAVHLYPETGKIDQAIETLAGFDLGKPIVIEETFPLRCSADEALEFLERSRQLVSGWLSFHWGDDPAALRRSGELRDAIVGDWIERFADRMRRTAAEGNE